MLALPLVYHVSPLAFLAVWKGASMDGLVLIYLRDIVGRWTVLGMIAHYARNGASPSWCVQYNDNAI